VIRVNTILAVMMLLFAAGCATMEDLPPAVVGEPPPTTRPQPAIPRPAPRPPPQVTAPEIPARDLIAVQALLDRQNLSCNCADGVAGQRTQQALGVWQERNGLPVTGEFDEATREKFGPLDSAFAAHIVSAEEHAALAAVPRTWVGKSQVSRLGYETILEAVAEEYHASEGAIRDLNPGAAWPDPAAGTSLVVPNPQPFQTPAAARLTIILSQKLIRAYDAQDRLIAQFPCSIAKDKSKRPRGELRIVNCAANPNYYFDPALFAEDPEAARIGRKLIIPPGPNNPVGVAWVSLSLPGYGIHGSPHPEDIGKTESHGCFRLANWNAEKLLKMISIGLPIRVDE
jgi:lipoprotein-anchoring transpeptidase ErfK/SrfK